MTKLKKHLDKIKAQTEHSRQLPRILIFVNTIKKTRILFNELQNVGFRIAMLHGKRTQAERNEAMDGFRLFLFLFLFVTLSFHRSGKIHILVATDVASRGLDVKNLPYVVNYDFPSNLETYIHRIGRTGRLAEHGHAFSFLTRNFAPLAEDLISLLQHHRQEIDPNLILLQNAYKEAFQCISHPGDLQTTVVEAGETQTPIHEAIKIEETQTIVDDATEMDLDEKAFLDRLGNALEIKEKARPASSKRKRKN